MDDYEARDLDRRIAHADDMQMREKQEAYDQIRKLRARIEAYEAALRDLVAACTTGETYADGRPAGSRAPEFDVLERARKPLGDA